MSKPVSRNLKAYQKDHPGISRKQAFDKLALHQWHYFFEPKEAPELTKLCKKIAHGFLKQNPTWEGAILLESVCQHEQFGVYVLPPVARVPQLFSEENYIVLSPRTRVAHAGLMVPFGVRHLERKADYRKMFVQVNMLSKDLILHEMAHAMEDRVEYTEENHDGNFMKFYEQLKQYVAEMKHAKN